MFGYISWDAVPTMTKVELWQGIEHPLAYLVERATIVLFDNFRQTVTVAAHSQRELEQTLETLKSAPDLTSLPLPDPSRIPTHVDLSMSDANFEGSTRRAQEYIAAGDAFQIVLARSFRVPQRGRDPFEVYRALRVLNPSPYMYYLDLPPDGRRTSRIQIAGASPETLVRLESDVMTVRPIAGTRPRGCDAAEDVRLERELLADPKERAEHLMLIDLGRNDVGRVCEIGSVAVVRNMEVEHYSHVMHIVSEVQGRVRSAVSPMEVLQSAFPAGTLSGAPKVRAMQIIRELEPEPRGIYGGAIGYVDDTGQLDFAIAIRTAVCENGVFTVTAGAGIVEASVPSLEAEETRNKARGVLCAIENVPCAGA